MSREGLPRARRRITINDRTKSATTEHIMYAVRRAIKSCGNIKCDLNIVVESEGLFCLVKKLNSHGSFMVDVMDEKERQETNHGIISKGRR